MPDAGGNAVIHAAPRQSRRQRGDSGGNAMIHAATRRFGLQRRDSRGNRPPRAGEKAEIPIFNAKRVSASAD